MKSVSLRVSLVVLCVLSFCMMASAVLAQTGATGALTVMAKDPSGAVIAGASVTVRNTSGLVRTETTIENGSYTFTLLPPGSYAVSISAPGFKTVDVPSVTVDVAETHVLEQKLEIGSTTQEVTVTSEVQTVQTESSTLGGVVSGNNIQALPLITRNFTQITSLSPGVITDVYNAAVLGRGGLDFSVNGQNQSSNNIQVEGVSVNNLSTGQNTNPEGFYGDILYPNPDAIQEFKVQTGSYDAGYGRQSGGNVNVVTKSGTNNIHGSLFEYLRNTDFNANGFFQKEVGLPRGTLDQNVFGGTVGGPIKKDKLYYFFSYSGTRQVNGIAAQGFQTVNVPPQLTNVRTAAALGAEFCPANNPTGQPGAAYAYTSPASGTAQNPASDQVQCSGANINPVALNLLNAKYNGQYIVPTPQIIKNAGTSAAVGVFSASIPATFNESQAIGSVDYNLNSKNTISLKYFWDYGTQVRGFNCAPCTPGSGSRHLSGDNLDTGKWTTILTNNLVNEFHFARYYIRASVYTLDPLTHASLGMQNFAVNDWIDEGPTLAVSGLFSQGSAGTDGAHSPQWDDEVADQLSWTRGRQTMRMGFDYIYYGWDVDYFSPNRGGLTFSSFADLLLGETGAQNGTILSNVAAASGSITPVGGIKNHIRTKDPSAYFQDDIKVNQRLTLNLGLRWEYFGDAYTTDGNNFDNWYFLDQTVPIPPPGGTFAGYTVASNNPTPVPAGVFVRSREVQTLNGAPLHNWAPRLGFAWQPFANGKLVVRGGSGFFYSQVETNNMATTLSGNPPIDAPLSLSGTANAGSSWATPWQSTHTLGFATFIRTTNTTSAGILPNTGNIDPYLVTPHVINSNLNVQYEFAPSWVLELGYVYARGERLWGTHPLNESILATATTPVNCGLPTGCVTTNTAGNANNRVPIIGYASGGFSESANVGDSTYNSLQATVRKRFSHGLTMQASYTYGKALDDLVGLERGGSANSNDPTDLQQMKGNSDFNRPQRLSLNYSYTLPNFHNAQGISGRALSGWGIAGVTTIQSGEPQTLTDSLGGGVYGKAGSSRAELCPGFTPSQVKNSGSVESNLNHFYNLAAVADTSVTATSTTCVLPTVGAFVSGAIVSPGGTGYGDLGRGVVLGPGQNNWDISLSKKTWLWGASENRDVEFRAEFFNAFNKAQFAAPSSNAVSKTSTTFGVINSTAVGPRIIQLALRLDF